LNVGCEETDLPEGCQLGDCKDPIEMDTGPFTILELRQVISLLKNGKAPGVDNISAEMLKASPPIALDQLLRTSDWFPVETGVKQGCVMSGFLFNIIIDWVMRNITNARRGLWWKFTTVLEDLDYAHDIALLSSRHKDLQETFSRLHHVSRYTGLCINTAKTKVLRTNAKVTNTISIDGLEVEDVNSFIYLGAMVHGAGGSHEDISGRLSIGRKAYATLNPVWRSRTYSKHTKLRIFKSCVISTLLYGAEMWRVTSTDMERLDVFHRKRLRRILGIFWPYTISNRELYERAREGPVSETLKVRR